MNLKAVIVDDENKSREILKNLVEDFCKNVTVSAMAENVDEGIKAIREHSPDILFLDINMHRETGFDLLNKVGKIDFEIIFTTAYTEYALHAIKFSAIDYLLKPIDITELKNAVSKVEARRNSDNLHDRFELLLQNLKSDKSENYKIALPSSDGLVFIKIKDIIYCESSGNYTHFHLKEGKKYLVTKTLKEYDEILTPYNFFRIHNSYLVNMKEIKKYVRGEGGYVILNNDVSLDVSKRKKESFLHRISQEGLI